MKKLLLAIPFLISTLSYAAYEDHFPTYFEYCSGTQWKLQSGDEGGTPGHGFTYIHGLCKDYNSEYPQVVPCSDVNEKNKKNYPHEGVGISLDKNFTNVMWVAVPGKNLMFFGEKERGPISNADVENQVEKIIELKVFNQVKSKSDVMKPFTFGTPEYTKAVSKDTIGTDHAVNWARELHCVKIPFPEKALKNVAQFLNESNNKYKTGPAYEWNKVANNCVHLSINQSHALGISKEIKVDQKFISLLFNMALPSNGFLMYADKTVLKFAPGKRALKKAISQKGFHEVQLGSMMEVFPAYPTGDYFKTNDLTILTAPRILKPWKLLSTPRKYAKKYMTPANSELKENAEMWIERYEAILSELDKGEASSELGQYLIKQIELAKKIAAEE